MSLVAPLLTALPLLTPAASAPTADDPWPGVERLPALIEAHGLSSSYDGLMEVYRRLLKAVKAQRALPTFTAIVEDPWSAPARALELTDRMAAAAGAPEPDLASLYLETAAQLGLELEPLPAPAGLTQGSFLERMNAVVKLLEASAADSEAAFERVEDPFALLEASWAVHERLIETIYVIGEVPHAATWKSVQDVDQAMLLRAALRLAPLAGEDFREGLRNAYRAERPPRPDKVEGVKGRLLYARETRVGWVLVGSAGDNTYDLPVAFLFDLGGDDSYPSVSTSSDIDRPVNVVIDLEGADTYTGSRGQGAGIAGVSLLVDVQGADEYTEGRLVQGAGLLGVGTLLDLEGRDTYAGDVYAQGAGCFGVGLCIDGGDDDRMTSFLYSQGFASPLSVGALIDVAGNDQRECRGRYGSTYGTADEYNAFSQGAGVGFRVLDYLSNKAAGGLGILLDLEGDDRSTVGEFGQGIGYFAGTGIVRDMAGDDEVRASRYGIATGAHYGVGIVLDDGGDDLWHNPYTASIAGNWDLTLSFFLDRAGDDRYQAGGIGLGSATITSMACFIDGDGRDSYALGGTTCFGNAGHQSDIGRGSRSIGMFLDLGGDRDTYPETSPLTPAPGNDLESARHQTHTEGEGDAKVTAESGCGVFLDE